MNRPLLVMENANLMGLPTEEGTNRSENFKGERLVDIRFKSLYVHGALADACRYDIASLAAGHVKDKDVQRVTVVDENLRRHKAILVSVCYEYSKENIGRYGLVVYPKEARKTLNYLVELKTEAIKKKLQRINL